MKNNIFKIMSFCLCAVLLFGAVGGEVFALNNTAKKNEDDADPKIQATVSEKVEATKDETVYVIAGADGTVKKIIVSDWIKNTLGSAALSDKSELENIVNVKGDESFSMGGDKTAVWDASGNDIYYQGNINKELPVTISVTYMLDGKSVTPDELKGKNGKVTIRFDYTNQQYETVDIDGKREKIYVPFAMLTGMILDNDVFTNVEVTNGKLINDGSRTVVAGIAFPGLQEDLGIDRKKFEIPDYVEITADAKDFSLGMTVTVATNELFNAFDTEKLDGIDDLTGKLDELTGAMDQLLDGSSQLYDGLCTLLDKSGELVDGIEKLADGARELKDGAAALDDGAEQLQSGAKTLSEGLDTIASNNDALNNGAKQVFDTLLSTARTQLISAGLEVPEMTVSNYAEILNSVIASLDETKVYETALNTVTAAVEEKREYIESQVTAAVRAEVEKGVIAAVKAEIEAKVVEAVRAEVTDKVTAAVRSEIEAKVTEAIRSEVEAKVTASVRESIAEKVIYAATGMDNASYYAAVAAGLVDETTQAAVNAAIEAQMQSAEVQALIEQNLNAQMQSEQVKALITSNTDTQMQSDEAIAAIAANTDAQMQSDEVKALIGSNVDSQMQSDEVKTIIDANVSEQMAKDEIKALIAQNTEAQVKKAISEAMTGEEVQSKLTAASEGVKQVISLKMSLDSYNSFYLGLQSYTAGVAEAAAGAASLSTGASDLKSGTARLTSGAYELYYGILTLKNGMPTLVDGITKLRDGSMKLSDGLKEFNEKGVQKLVDTVDRDIGGLIDRIKVMSDVSKNYRNFSGLADDMDGKVKFIYRTDGIE